RVEARCPRGGEGVGGSRSDASHQRFPVLILKNKADAPRYIGLVYDHLHGGGTTLREPRTTCSPSVSGCTSKPMNTPSLASGPSGMVGMAMCPPRANHVLPPSLPTIGGRPW